MNLAPKHFRTLTLSLIVLITNGIYSMEPIPGSGDGEIPLEDLRLMGDTPPITPPLVAPREETPAVEATPAIQAPPPLREPRTPRANTPARTPLQNITSGRPETPPTRMRPIRATPSPIPPTPATPTPGRDTPNQAFVRAAHNALEALERGDITADEATRRIRQFLPPRAGNIERNIENRSPNIPPQ